MSHCTSEMPTLQTIKSLTGNEKKLLFLPQKTPAYVGGFFSPTEMFAKQKKENSKAKVWCDHYLIISSSSIIYQRIRRQSFFPVQKTKPCEFTGEIKSVQGKKRILYWRELCMSFSVQ